ncbi:hypothetical protein [Streptomyces sp. Rer75]|uniref:hypothetical protein n=1 Tax=unclassified Streptomyces TaxID=2593676 RepID=UPI0015CFCF77|nr:hypothetical protein [Streptomyces sp. Rer75]QLH21915.1 hypothetical protein HYQ63_15910 [Streptomyces sp. Rer75]
MGFDLNCVFTLDNNVFPLFDRVIPGGSGHALRTGGSDLPDGWVLPNPWELCLSAIAPSAVFSTTNTPPCS